VFAKYQFFGKNLFFTLILATMMIPFQVVMIPLYLVLVRLGLIDSLAGLIVPGATSAFGIFLMRQFIESLPSELIDAARIDGASEFGIYTRIVLPQMGAALATLGIFQFMGTWNEFMFSTTFIYDPRLKTIQPSLYQAVGRYSVDYTALSSGLILAIIPILIVFFTLQRQFIRGLTAGAFKG
jgi:ABC-type glycerol-3-phosphate transport system permease component